MTDRTPSQLAKIRAVQRRLVEQQRLRAKRLAGGKVDRKAMQDRSG